MIQKMFFKEGGDIREDICSKYGFNGDLLEYFVRNEGPAVHKWHHYIPIYDRYFSRFRDKNIKFLEIGVNNGGSMQLWRKYFGPDATIFGIDIDPKCSQFDGLAGNVRIGDQTDEEFLLSVVDEMGGVDVVLDDGSHQMAHIPVSLEVLFPKLNENGLYFIEDLHTSYWRKFGGGMRPKHQNFFNYIRQMIDDMYHWYHGADLKKPALSGEFSGIHIHDSIAVFEKGAVHAPVHSVIGEAK